MSQHQRHQFYVYMQYWLKILMEHKGSPRLSRKVTVMLIRKILCPPITAGENGERDRGDAAQGARQPQAQTKKT